MPNYDKAVQTKQNQCVFDGAIKDGDRSDNGENCDAWSRSLPLPVSSAETAEAVKLTENIFRAMLAGRARKRQDWDSVPIYILEVPK